MYRFGPRCTQSWRNLRFFLDAMKTVDYLPSRRVVRTPRNQVIALKHICTGWFILDIILLMCILMRSDWCKQGPAKERCTFFNT
jgi:hypothetical protein